MIQFETIFWCQEFEQLELATCSLRSYENQRQEIHNDQKVLLSRLSCLRFIEEHRDLHGNGDLVARVWFLRRQLENNEPSCAESLVRDLTGMKNQLKAALARKRFAFIPYPNDQYFEQDKLFGERVYEAFPQAREDVKSAGNAIAAELYTASVFHLMRVSEYGLRALARRLRVRTTDKHRPQRLNTRIGIGLLMLARGRSVPAESCPTGQRNKTPWSSTPKWPTAANTLKTSGAMRHRILAEPMRVMTY
jgi:hypothetical protein